MSNYYHIRHINTQIFIAWYQQKLILASWPSLCICSWEGITRYKSLVSVILNMYNQRDESFVVIYVAVVRSFISSLNAWWRHQMEAFSALLAICAGIHPVPGEYPTQRPVTRSLDVFFDPRLDKRLSKQSRGWWFEAPATSLWRHYNGLPNRYILMYNCVFIDNIEIKKYLIWQIQF